MAEATATNCPMVSLGDILTKSEEWIELNPEETYKQVTVRMWGQGVVQRSEVTGLEIASKRMLVVRVNQFIISRIDARNGASGLIPDFLDGAVVTNDFPVFTPDPSKVLPEFLSWMSKTHDFIELCKAASEGTTNRVRLKEDRFLSMEISLPPITEQRRIVARIEELAAKVEEARGLRFLSAKEVEMLASSSLASAFSEQLQQTEWALKPLTQAAIVARGKFAHRPRNDPRFYGGDIPFIQIGNISNSNRYIREYSQTLNEEGLKISRLFPIGTVVIAITGATIGATGILTFESCFPDSIVGITPSEDQAIPEFVYYAVNYTKKVALETATQTTQPNINLKDLEKIMIPIPSITEQKTFVTYLESLETKIASLEQLQIGTKQEINALIPSILDKAFKGEL